MNYGATLPEVFRTGLNAETEAETEREKKGFDG